MQASLIVKVGAVPRSAVETRKPRRLTRVLLAGMLCGVGLSGAALTQERIGAPDPPNLFGAALADVAEDNQAKQPASDKETEAKVEYLRATANEAQSKAEPAGNEAETTPLQQQVYPLALSPSPECGRQDALSGPLMRVIPPGVFLMGSPPGELERGDNEGPQRRVRIEKAFALSVCEITVAQFSLFVDQTAYQTTAESGQGCWAWDAQPKRARPDKSVTWRSPGFSSSDRHPVVCVSYDDARAYIAWLNQRTGRRYRLPSEAEWEYAARARTEQPFSTGACITTQQANFDDRVGYVDCPTSGETIAQTVPVGRYPPNAFGLHDMHGNVWEWVEDCGPGNYQGAPIDGRAWGGEDQEDCSIRVVRGGGWDVGPEDLRSADRSGYTPVAAYFSLGFRLARDL